MARILALALLCLLLAACAPRERAGAGEEAALARDPVVARALHDPLMSDPDLASRNEANAILGQADSSALPLFKATREAARAAREAARTALLEGGPIPALPPPAEAAFARAPGPQADAGALLAALGAPAACARRLGEDFLLAADLPPAAALPPQAMVLQAAGADQTPCRIRIIRYATPAAGEDVLHYHYVRARRAGLAATRYSAPAALIAAQGKAGARLLVLARPAAHGMTAVELLYRAP
ncbi:MAG: hypothetical protein KatS3mg120_0401 [Erythrobacter sp.]|nr:MAG: hypothetical protein KatS3mg120_0401 [Erythrobacter sp.]